MNSSLAWQVPLMGTIYCPTMRSSGLPLQPCPANRSHAPGHYSLLSLLDGRCRRYDPACLSARVQVEYWRSLVSLGARQHGMQWGSNLMLCAMPAFWFPPSGQPIGGNQRCSQEGSSSTVRLAILLLLLCRRWGRVWWWDRWGRAWWLHCWVSAALQLWY
jgi:hypothetical protein